MEMFSINRPYLRKIAIASIFLALFNLMAMPSFADRGLGKKKGSDFGLSGSAARSSGLNFNLRSGVTYTGSVMSTTSSFKGNSLSTYVTYQKGNTVFIVPYKQQTVVGDYHVGYSGMKLIIRKK